MFRNVKKMWCHCDQLCLRNRYVRIQLSLLCPGGLGSLMFLALFCSVFDLEMKKHMVSE